MLRRNSEPVHRLIYRFRIPIVAAMVVFVNAHHLLTRRADLEWRLTSMVVIYGVLGPILAWLLLGWLAHLSRRADDAAQARMHAMHDLQRRNEQVQALYEASRLLAGAKSVEQVLEPVLAAALRASAADGGVLSWHATDTSQPKTIAIGTVPDEIHLSSQACELCPSSLPCPLPQHITCIPLRSGVTHLGQLRLYGGRRDSLSERGLRALASELEFTWAARNAERRTLAALERAHGDADPAHDALRSFLRNLASAIDADGAAYARTAHDALAAVAAWGDIGTHVWPTQHSKPIVWDAARRTTHIAAGSSGWLRLHFAAPQAEHALDPRFLAPLSAQAALLADLQTREARTVWRERTRLAGEMHDGLAQTLAYLHLQIAQVPALVATDAPGSLRTRFAELADRTLEAYEGVRTMIDDLRLLPREGESADGFLTRVSALACRRAGVTLDIDLPTPLQLTPPATAQLARALQEAIVNAVTHGLAGHLSVKGARHASGMQIDVRDDGLGFDPNSVPPTGRHGIAIMKDRIASLGGIVELESAHGAGTTIRINVPPTVFDQAMEPT